ncbi:exo-alpha-sialidase [Crossiella sp. CA-258035]|uniref:exo-alpha-sialidase n=1 Tax=Crossiella sp. CA-258035 TaxID=2981138 RepID=UPI0032DA9DE6
MRVTALFSLLLLLLAGLTAPVAAAQPVEQALFKAANETGYHCFRIPAVVRTAQGSLLAFAEGRVLNCGDTGDIDVVLKRSTDGGQTWSPLRLVNEGKGDTHGNPVPVVDHDTGRIFLFTSYNKGRTDDKPCDVPCKRTPHVQHSDDDGLTWSAPVEMSAQVKLPAWDYWYATGPGHGIQLTRGPHKGRLVFGVCGETSDRGSSKSVANEAALVYSDDHGKTWQVGAVDSITFPPGGPFPLKPQELTVTELADGSIYAGAREQGGSAVGNHSFAISKDGGATFSQRFQAIPDLVMPTVQGAVLRLERTGRPDRLLFSAPADTDRRRWMTIRSSYDHGRSWENAEQGTRITSDWSGYSDLVQLSDPSTPSARIGLLYEGGKVDARDEIRFTRFTEDDLGWRNPAGPATPDTSRIHKHANAIGGPALTAGRFGKALELDGADDYLRVPYDRARLPGDGELTFSTWFRYGGTQREQVLLWLGGMGESAPQLWLRAEPANKRLVARITTPSGSSSVATANAHDDNQWHHVALQRSAGRLLLWVDGVQAGSAAAVAGSVTQRVSFQLVLGQRLDHTQRFDGALDEVRLHTRALTKAELDRLRLSNADLPDGQVLRLPLDSIQPTPCTSVPYTAGTEGYHTFRIPAVVRASSGEVLAFAEGRVHSAGDTGAIHVVLRRSSDGGCTWGPLSVVSRNGEATAGNPAPVALPGGEVLLLTTRNGPVTEREIMTGAVAPADTRRVFLQRSRDNGRSWTPEREITSAAKKPDWRWYATGPGHAITTRQGRIVVPANHSSAPPSGSADTGAEQKYHGGHALLSDDGGHTWRIGFTEDRADTQIAANETTVAQLPDGRLYFSSRNQGTLAGRLDAVSHDGGRTLSSPYRPQRTIEGPRVQGSVLQTDDPGLLLYSGPADPAARRAMSVRASTDHGRTWWQLHRVSEAPAAYSDLVRLNGSTVGLLYETGVRGPYETITFTQLR